MKLINVMDKSVNFIRKSLKIILSFFKYLLQTLQNAYIGSVA